jgi:hypothetical protein
MKELKGEEYYMEKMMMKKKKKLVEEIIPTLEKGLISVMKKKKVMNMICQIWNLKIKGKGLLNKMQRRIIKNYPLVLRHQLKAMHSLKKMAFQLMAKLSMFDK